MGCCLPHQWPYNNPLILCIHNRSLYVIYLTNQKPRYVRKRITETSFSCCPPDDDAADWKGLKQKQKKEEKKNEANKSKDKNKDKSKSDAKELQSIAFGGGSNKKKNKKKNNKQNSSSKEDPVQNISSNKEVKKMLP